MPHVVTRSCCADAACVFACPVNCIHPTPDEPDFATAEMLYVDPRSCVDCGACVSACPVSAIKPHTALTDAEMPFMDLNAAAHTGPPGGPTGGIPGDRPHPPLAPVPPIVRKERPGPLRVAVVGAGPAALYAADALLRQDDTHVTVLDRLPVPHGLARHGVAPDHPDTRQVVEHFAEVEEQTGFAYRLGVDVGRDVTLDDLRAHHHAVLYATGAASDRRLGVPGEDLPGSASATALVGWYNGHPDHADLDPDLTGGRVVVVGNGNVALDVARMLAGDPERLAGTDVAPAALAALRASRVREVVVLGRRGPAQAAFTLPELLGLLARDDIEVVAEGLHLDEGTARRRADGTLDPVTTRKLDALEALAEREAAPGARRVVLRFCAQPVAVTGDDRATGVEVVPTRLEAGPDGRVAAVPDGGPTVLEAGLVLRSVGYRGTPVPGLPHDEASGRVVNVEGRVGATGAPLPGVYVAGWAKRGPTGFIGTNKSCARETVDHLVRDHDAGLLPEPAGDAAAFDTLLAERCGPLGERVRDLAAYRAATGVRARSPYGSGPDVAAPARPAARSRGRRARAGR